MKTKTRVWLKEGNAKEIEVYDADMKSYSIDGSIFMLKKEGKYAYLIPADNIYLIETVSVDEDD